MTSQHGYDKGRLDLPFVGHCTFGKRPICADWNHIEADAAILGVPYDMGTQYRAGARFGPRAIREASTLFSFGHGGSFDHEDDITYLPADTVRIVDIGDVDIVHTDTVTSQHQHAAGRVANSSQRRASGRSWRRSCREYSVHPGLPGSWTDSHRSNRCAS